MNHVDLCARLDRHADRLTERVLTEMYKNPFWMARFGDRANRHGRQDGRFHIDYLMQALGSNDAGIMVHYARWLQQVLTTRGMCSRHLADNFERLATAIGDEKWADGEPAVVMLHRATDALTYPAGPARAVQEHARVLVEATTQVLYTRHPEWPASSRGRCADDLAYHVSYAADALALGSARTFVSYVQWIAEFLTTYNVTRGHVLEALETLREVPDAPPELRDVLGEAVTSLSA